MLPAHPTGQANSDVTCSCSRPNRLVLLWAGWSPGMAVLHHVGRKSGTPYRTPLNVFPTDGGFLFLVGYGPRTDWLKNVNAHGTAEIEHYGKRIEVTEPRLTTKSQAAELVPLRWRPVFAVVPFDEALLLTAARA
ncbi:nitroreductase family deazaflavin-dependent oxidoreductase [Mycobacterium sp. pUA109]|uniref:nitroreductase family deazaflavin-dependent oxidoreductase n=1 Tax=Mycobacterium sp. pUA109 TaxID=3238982 RepID=UPI00351B0588